MVTGCKPSLSTLHIRQHYARYQLYPETFILSSLDPCVIVDVIPRRSAADEINVVSPALRQFPYHPGKRIQRFVGEGYKISSSVCIPLMKNSVSVHTELTLPLTRVRS